jgi:hypothetical protein
MIEQEMRERVECFLESYRRRALVSVLGIGIGVGGCATTSTLARPAGPAAPSPWLDRSDANEGDADQAPEEPICVAKYSAPRPER